MATVPFIFGTNAIADTITAAKAALNAQSDPSRQCLVIFFDDIANALPDGTTQTPDTGEDWLALVAYHTVDVTTATQNITREFASSIGGRTVDQGFYIPGNTYDVRPITINFYTLSTASDRPSLADL